MISVQFLSEPITKVSYWRARATARAQSNWREKVRASCFTLTDDDETRGQLLKALNALHKKGFLFTILQDRKITPLNLFKHYSKGSIGHLKSESSAPKTATKFALK